MPRILRRRRRRVETVIGRGDKDGNKGRNSNLVGRVLKTLHTDTNNRPGDPITIDRIVSLMESDTGEKLYDGAADDVKNEMRRRESAGNG
jgi:hypothetical protein